MICGSLPGSSRNGCTTLNSLLSSLFADALTRYFTHSSSVQRHRPVVLDDGCGSESHILILLPHAPCSMPIRLRPFYFDLLSFRPTQFLLSLFRIPHSEFRIPHSTALCHLTSVFCHLSSVFCHPSSALRHLTSVFCHLSSVICSLIRCQAFNTIFGDQNRLLKLGGKQSVFGDRRPVVVQYS